MVVLTTNRFTVSRPSLGKRPCLLDFPYGPLHLKERFCLEVPGQLHDIRLYAIIRICCLLPITDSFSRHATLEIVYIPSTLHRMVISAVAKMMLTILVTTADVVA